MPRLESNKLSSKTTALEVVQLYGTGQYLKGKTAIVTGGNSGIGLETVKALASAGARVILCSRSVENGKKAIVSEILEPGEGKYVVPAANDLIVVKPIDLADLKSVKAFAEDILKTEERIDFLILNAGIMATKTREETKDGFEKQIGVCHFGHQYLTQLLLPKMKAQSFKSRIVVLSSIAHAYLKGTAELMISDPHFSNGRKYNEWGAYGSAKTANMLFTRKLGEVLKGTSVTASSCHPGVIQTPLFQNVLTPNSWVGWIAGSFMSLFVFDKTIPQGAATTLFCALSPEIEERSGCYVKDCGNYEDDVSAAGADSTGEHREALWVMTEKTLSEKTSSF